MSQKPSRPRTGGGRSEPRGIDQAGELIDPESIPATEGLSRPDSAGGKLQRVCLELLREHEQQGEREARQRAAMRRLLRRGGRA